MWICPKCKENIEDQFEQCWNCATVRDLNNAAPIESAKPSVEAVLPEPPVADTRKCPFCAEEIKREAIFCKHCRQSIPPAVPPAAAPAANPAATNTSGCFAIVMVVIAIVSLCVLMAICDTKEGTPPASQTNSSGEPRDWVNEKKFKEANDKLNEKELQKRGW